MFETIEEKAREIGKLLSRTDEFQAVKKANERLGEDRETVEMMNRLADLEGQLTAYIRAGREPEKELQEEFSKLAEEIQQKSVYQAVVAAQSNFERMMGRINEEIARGLEVGDSSRIILP